MDFVDIRVRFKKQGSARFISHLDLSRFMQRALKRSGLPIWHTEGFNPHPYVTFALPLSLGQTGTMEVMDFRITKYLPARDIFDSLQSCLTEDLALVSVYEPKHKAKEISFALYEMIFPDRADLIDEFNDFINQNEILVEKSTKKKNETIDLKSIIKKIDTSVEDDALKVEIILPAGTQLNINPSLFISAFSQFMNEDISPVFITRKGIYLSDMTEFK